MRGEKRRQKGKKEVKTTGLNTTPGEEKRNQTRRFLEGPNSNNPKNRKKGPISVYR
jgi:hypothetical protein